MFNLFKKKREILDYQKEFDTILKELITPLVKDNNFKKNGNNYFRVCGDLAQTFTIQKNRFNSKERVSFTVNIGFFNEKIFMEHSDYSIPLFPKPWDGFFLSRSGDIFYGYDKWFVLSEKNNIKEKKEIEMVFKKIMKLFNTHTTLISLKEFMAKYGSESLEHVSFLLAIKERERAEKLLRKIYKDNLAARPTTVITISSGGSEKVETIFDDTSKKQYQIYLNTIKDFANRTSISLE
jgi:hypothetical protein